MTDGRTAVYRFYDTEGGLLYVGITSNLMARWRWHAKNADWWPRQARIDVVWHDTREAADAEETQAIRLEGAMANMQKRGKTPLKSMRVSDDLWDEFGAVADTMDLTRTDLIRDFMRWFVGTPGVACPHRPAAVAPEASVDAGQ